MIVIYQKYFFLYFQCDCGGDLECLNARRRIEACRSDVVYANRLDTVVSCTEAQWICSSDAECSKALEYYNILCRGMFKGKRCNQRCKNSIQILSRQTKAIKLGKKFYCDKSCNKITFEFSQYG